MCLSHCLQNVRKYSHWSDFEYIRSFSGTSVWEVSSCHKAMIQEKDTVCYISYIHTHTLLAKMYGFSLSWWGERELVKWLSKCPAWARNHMDDCHVLSETPSHFKAQHCLFHTGCTLERPCHTLLLVAIITTLWQSHHPLISFLQMIFCKRWWLLLEIARALGQGL